MTANLARVGRLMHFAGVLASAQRLQALLQEIGLAELALTRFNLPQATPDIPAGDF